MTRQELKKARDAILACHLTCPIGGVSRDSGGIKSIIDPLDLLELIDAEIERIRAAG